MIFFDSVLITLRAFYFYLSVQFQPQITVNMRMRVLLICARVHLIMKNA